MSLYKGDEIRHDLFVPPVRADVQLLASWGPAAVRSRDIQSLTGLR